MREFSPEEHRARMSSFKGKIKQARYMFLVLENLSLQYRELNLADPLVNVLQQSLTIPPTVMDDGEISPTLEETLVTINQLHARMELLIHQNGAK